MSMSILEEQRGAQSIRREIETPVEKDHPARRFSRPSAKGVKVYEYAGNDGDGRRVYRHVSTERA